MTAERPTRRQFLLSATALAATMALAGCQARAASLDPEVPEDRLADTGWQHVADIDEATAETIDIAGTSQRVQVRTRAELYENDQPVRRVVEQFGGDAEAIDIPAELFIAAKARTDPPLIQLLARSETAMKHIMDIAERKAKHQLHQQGMRNVRRVDDGSLDIVAGGTALHRRYRADYPYDSFRTTYKGVPISVETGVFTLEAQLAVWPFRDLLVTGAGVYPGEPGHLTITVQGTTHDLPLALRPKRYRQNVRTLIRHVT